MDESYQNNKTREHQMKVRIPCASGHTQHASKIERMKKSMTKEYNEREKMRGKRA